MERHTDKLSAKAKECEVRPTAYKGEFAVKSPSGSEYTVTMLAAGNHNECGCTCKWSEYHPTKVCAHRLAVILWLEASGRRWASFWATEGEAKRQHRHTERVQDVYMTTRARA